MKIEKQFATLALCLAVLWGSRFGPYSCGTLAGFSIGATSSWQAIVVTGVLLTIFLFVPAYDFISFLTYKPLGEELRTDQCLCA
jgi:hypothetical protein